MIYSRLRLRADVVNFRCVCRLWNDVASHPRIRKERWCRQRTTCAMGNGGGISRCFGIGEFQCEVCDPPEGLCFTNALIHCMKCGRRLGPSCCISLAPLCIECAPEECPKCQKPVQKFRDRPSLGFLSNQRSMIFLYCSHLQKALCYDCYQASTTILVWYVTGAFTSTQALRYE